MKPSPVAESSRRYFGSLAAACFLVVRDRAGMLMREGRRAGLRRGMRMEVRKEDIFFTLCHFLLELWDGRFPLLRGKLIISFR